MRVRRPVVAGQFYPADRAGCIRMIQECLPREIPADLPRPIIAGIVPHAGWVYSGAVAAKVFAAIQAQGTPDTVVLVSADHRWGTPLAALYGSGAWLTPLGEAPIDEELAEVVLREGQGLVEDVPQAHSGEHSAEVQVPFIQYLFPQARILPILVSPTDRAVQVGEALARAIQGVKKSVVVVGTTTLTHYGAMFYGFAPAGTGERALAWARANDERIIRLMLEMRAEEVVAETETHHNACGGGAIAATVSAARALGAKKGVLLEYTNSHFVMPRGPATDFVGYAAVVFG